MTTILQSPYFHIFSPIVLAVIMNYIIFTNHWNKMSTSNDYLPPGSVIGSIWVIIFGLLGYAHFILYSNKKWLASGCIVGLLLFCISYPLLTNGLSNLKFGNILNSLTLILSFVVSIIVFDASRSAFYYMLPLLVWASYVNLADRLYK
jgi:tryptophan-rich sensory protein